VNIAARVQALADANEVYITADVYNSSGVSDVLKAHHLVPDEVLVKGVSEKLYVYKISLRFLERVLYGSGLGGKYSRYSYSWAAVHCSSGATLAQE
jgi:hypothetical protein